MSAPLKLPKFDDSLPPCRALLAFNVGTFRVVRKLSQEQLALEAELDRTYISAIERGRVNVSLDNIERLAKTLQVEPWELLRPPQRSTS